MENFNSFWKGKNVLITGHTGFKGAWLSLILKNLDANIFGVSKEKYNSGFYFETGLDQMYEEEYLLDLSEEKQVHKLSTKVENKGIDIVFHFAAQAIVSQSFISPLETIKANTLGTYLISNLVNQLREPKVLVIATTDKVYKDHSKKNKENDELGGEDIYSSSKASAELLTHAFINSFKRESLNISTVRSGNVLGGGDIGKNRLVPDIITSLKSSNDIIIRNPESTRPWQSIFDSIHGYLKVGYFNYFDQNVDSWNINSELNNKYTVKEIVDMLLKLWGGDTKVIVDSNQTFHESKLLNLDSSKAEKNLDWLPMYDMHATLEDVVNWEKSENKEHYSNKTIQSFLEKII